VKRPAPLGSRSPGQPGVQLNAPTKWYSSPLWQYRSTMDPLFKQIMILFVLVFAIIILLVVYIVARTHGA
jgi:hypothetical protein